MSLEELVNRTSPIKEFWKWVEEVNKEFDVFIEDNKVLKKRDREKIAELDFDPEGGYLNVSAFNPFGMVYAKRVAGICRRILGDEKSTIIKEYPRR